MEFDTLVTRDIGGLGGGAGGGETAGRDCGNDIQVSPMSKLPMRQTTAPEYSVRGRGRGRGRGREKGRGRPLPPPFLTKIYQMVDDPTTSSVISWGSNNTSFIILDQIKFVAEILPKYFKHSNFSSFVYQLNNYGFRKTSWDKAEYENPWFQAGKEHWLLNITRRNQRSESEITLQQVSLAPSDDFVAVRMETELETLRSLQNSMKVEIQRLKKQQEEMENQFKSFEESTIFTDGKHAEMVIPLLAQQFIEHLKEKREMYSKETSKKQKLVASGSTEISEDGKDREEILRQNADGNDQVTQELNEMQPDGEIMSSPNDSGSSSKQQKNGSTFAENCAFWKKILEDSDQENEGQEKLAENQPKIIIKLEDLMAANIPNEGEKLDPKALNRILNDFFFFAF